MKKSGCDHTLAVIKAGLALVPVVGGSISSLVGDYIPTATEKSRDRAIELLTRHIEALGDRIDVEAVDKNDFAELFKSCYLSIVRSHRDEKLRAATTILANLLLREGDPDKLSYTELDHFARCVETLSSGAIEVLGSFVQRARSQADFNANFFTWDDNTGRNIDSFNMNFGEISKEFSQHSPDLLMGLVAELDAANLIYRGDAPAIKTENYGNHQIRMTPLGARFARMLIGVEE